MTICRRSPSTANPATTATTSPTVHTIVGRTHPGARAASSGATKVGGVTSSGAPSGVGIAVTATSSSSGSGLSHPQSTPAAASAPIASRILRQGPARPTSGPLEGLIRAALYA